MSVGKEEIHEIMQLMSEHCMVLLDNEGQPEAADTGIYDISQDRRRIQSLISRIKSFAWNQSLSFPEGRVFHAFIAWERDEDHYNGTHIFIKWFKATKRFRAYFEVTMDHGYMTAVEHDRTF